MLLFVALAEICGMTLWFSTTAAGPAVAREFAIDDAMRAWLTMAVQAGFVAGTLLTAVTSTADAINARPRLLWRSASAPARRWRGSTRPA